MSMHSIILNRSCRRAFLGALVVIKLGWMVALGCLAGASAFSCQQASSSEAKPVPCVLQATRLTTERRVNPLGIDELRPRFGWQLMSSQRGATQSAYQLQVQAGFNARWDQEAALVWDSGKLPSSSTLNIPYAGARLQSSLRYLWRVRVWDGAGSAADWSGAAHWEMGLLGEQDWGAQWIGDGRPGPKERADFYLDDAAPMLRRSFELKHAPLRARLYLAGPGYWEGSLNGVPLDDSVLNPSWTDFDQLVSYRVFDVTGHLQTGENVLGVMLGNGWYNPLPLEFFEGLNFRDHLAIGRPCLRAKLVLSMPDGSELVHTSDEKWRVAAGPILRNNIYLGEVYDARLEQSGWSKPGFDDSHWQSASVAKGPSGVLRADTIAPIRPQEELPAQSLHELEPGVFVFDVGRNLAGWARLSLQGARGKRVSLRYAELLNEDGSLNTNSSVAGWVRAPGKGGPGAPDRAEQRDEYILRGGQRESYRARFSFHGFRYVEVSGLESAPQLSDLVAIPLSSDVPIAGRFECSDERINAIQRMVTNTFRSNLFSIQSDCPQRERLAYGGDIVATSQAFMLNYEMANFYSKTVQDFASTRGVEGGLAETAPFVGLEQYGFGEGSGPVGWAFALPHLLQQNYRYYGEQRQIEQHYRVVCDWLEFLKKHSDGGVIQDGLGDHGNISWRRYAWFVSSICFGRAARVAQQLAEILDLPQEASEHGRLAELIHASLAGHKRLSPARKSRLGDGSQAMQSVALRTGFLKGEAYARGLQILLERLESDEWKIETGLVATQDMFEVLGENGEIDAAWRLLTRREFPGWGFMLERGATTLWEVWEDDPVRISRNHPMLGSISAWFYRYLAGIQIAPEAVGCDRVLIQPLVPSELASASASYASIRGEIKSAWSQEDGVFSLQVNIPVGVQATIALPVQFSHAVTESGRALNEAPGVQLLDASEQEWIGVRCQVGAGSYLFRAKAGE